MKLPLSRDLTPTVYLVDDDHNDIILNRRLCESVGLTVRCFESPRQFLDEHLPNQPGCVVTDLLMPEMTGLQLYSQLRQRGSELPIIVITGHADARTCRTALHEGVFDFVEKSYNPHDLLVVIREAITHSIRQNAERHERERHQRKLQTLSPRENEVMRVLARGWTLKEVAAHFKISVQTASKHRSSLFEKLAVNNEVELLKLLMRVDPRAAEATVA